MGIEAYSRALGKLAISLLSRSKMGNGNHRCTRGFKASASGLRSVLNRSLVVYLALSPGPVPWPHPSGDALRHPPPRSLWRTKIIQAPLCNIERVRKVRTARTAKIQHYDQPAVAKLASSRGPQQDATPTHCMLGQQTAAMASVMPKAVCSTELSRRASGGPPSLDAFPSLCAADSPTATAVSTHFARPSIWQPGTRVERHHGRGRAARKREHARPYCSRYAWRILYGVPTALRAASGGDVVRWSIVRTQFLTRRFIVGTRVQ